VMPFFKLNMGLAEPNYPESLSGVVVINAPMIFPLFWRIARPWVDDYTASKVQVLGSNYQDALREIIGEDSLPEEYGGKCRCPDGCLPNARGSPPGFFDEAALNRSTQAVKARVSPLVTVQLPSGKVHTVEVKVEERDIKESHERGTRGRVALEYYYDSDRDIRFAIDFLPLSSDPLFVAEHRADAPAPALSPSHTDPSQVDLAVQRAQADVLTLPANQKKLEKLRMEKMVKVQPLTKFHSDQCPQAGVVHTYEAGTFFLRFDNANSYWSSKKVNFGHRFDDPRELARTDPVAVWHYPPDQRPT